jgi:hypothetical protein
MRWTCARARIGAVVFSLRLSVPAPGRVLPPALSGRRYGGFGLASATAPWTNDPAHSKRSRCVGSLGSGPTRGPKGGPKPRRVPRKLTHPPHRPVPARLPRSRFRSPASKLRLWEERFGIHLFTVAATIAGLTAASALLPEGDPLGARAKTSADRMRTVMSERFRDRNRPGWARRIDADSGALDWTADASVLGLWLLGVRPADDDELPPHSRLARIEVAWPGRRIRPLEGDAYCRDPELPPKVAGNPGSCDDLGGAGQGHGGGAGLGGSGPRRSQTIPHCRGATIRAPPGASSSAHDGPGIGLPLVWSHASVVALASAVYEVIADDSGPWRLSPGPRRHGRLSPPFLGSAVRLWPCRRAC